MGMNRELKTAFEGQGHRPQRIARIVDEFEVLAARLAKLLRVVTDDDPALAQMRRDQSECRPSHWCPDVDEHEVDWSVYIRERLPQIAGGSEHKAFVHVINVPLSLLRHKCPGAHECASLSP
jgi:hypothetical protein